MSRLSRRICLILVLLIPAVSFGGDSVEMDTVLALF